jgi:hypothetical protein
LNKRPRKKGSGEISAKLISDYLPFMEYELHRQLLGKLKLKAMNMLYGLKVQISIGENLIIGMAEATACYAAALPQPMTPKIVFEKPNKTKQDMDEIEQLKKLLTNEITKNKEFFNLNTPGSGGTKKANQTTAPSSNSSGSSQNPDNDNQMITPLQSESKALFKIELDDFRDNDSVYVLLDSSGIAHKKGFHMCSTELMPGLDKFQKHLQMFYSVYRCETSLVQMNTKKFNEICDEILESLQYKFRKYPNCCLTNLSFDSSLYDDDHAMIILTGCCLTYKEKEDEEKPPAPTTESVKLDSKGVEVSNLSYIPNAQIDNYLGLINLFLIRESAQIKENGGLSGFMHCFISEVLALCRSHVLSLGGNALVSFRMNECVLLDNPHRNQGQCLINVSGDAVQIRPC